MMEFQSGSFFSLKVFSYLVLDLLGANANACEA